ncbi:MAG: glycosyl hydrolase family 18 protein [bacterium]|nr:glycosyl hydrolase family 18 protein [bacterium]
MKRRAVAALALGLAFLAAGCPAARRLSPAPAHLLGVVFENGRGDIFDDSFPHLRRRFDRIDLVFPFWYSLEVDGSLVKERRRDEVIDFVQERRIDLLPLVNNLRRPGVEAGRVLRDAKARARAIRELLGLVGRHPYGGLLLDFVGLEERDRDPLTMLVDELGPALRSRGLRLGVAVYPRGNAYDYRELARQADFLLLMAVDNHWPGTPPGPIAPLLWVRQTAETLARAGVPRDRILLVVGAYGYDWPLENGEARVDFLPARELRAIARAHRVPVRWDEASQQPYFRYTNEGTEHEVWYQNAHSIRQRAALARELRLGGVVLWRLGFEEPETWPFLSEALRRD